MSPKRVQIYRVNTNTSLRYTPRYVIGSGKTASVVKGEYVKLTDKNFVHTEYVTAVNRCKVCGKMTQIGLRNCMHNAPEIVEQRFKQVKTLNVAPIHGIGAGYIESSEIDYVGEFMDDKIEEFKNYNYLEHI